VGIGRVGEMLRGYADCRGCAVGTSRRRGDAMTDEEIEAMVASLPLPPCAELLGWRLLGADVARGWIKVEFVGRPEFLNPPGRVQGGFLAAMLDDTMEPAVFVKSEGALYASSIDMNVSFLTAAKPGP
jgi:acyl-coenzyme A thioesterase PaaI-like protein